MRDQIMLILIILIVLEMNQVTGEECMSIDIRESPDTFYQLSNCTKISGNLVIAFLHVNGTYHDLEFPELREITGYFIIFRVTGLKTLRKLFPNLTVIRGVRLITTFAFILFELPDLQEIGLKSLIAIQRGYAFIKRTPLLCFAATIDWTAITHKVEQGVGNIIHLLANSSICPTACNSNCPSNYCWNTYDCQVFDTPNREECDKNCLGGCSGTRSGCVTCRGPNLNGVCVEKCPENTFLYHSGMSCLTDDGCDAIDLIPDSGECRKICTVGSREIIVDRDVFNETRKVIRCIKCDNYCPKVCNPAEITHVDQSDDLRGCTEINGTLQIRINVDVSDTAQRLEKNLGDIVKIRGSLKVYRSMAITSLYFMKSLSEIATNLTESEYSIDIYENYNLQSLWNWTDKIAMNMTGGIKIQHNSRLCMEEIRKLQLIAIHNQSSDFIATESNGYEQLCYDSLINTTCTVLSPNNVTITWERYLNDDDKTKLTGYVIYYLETPEMNFTYLNAIDACSTDSWESQFVEVKDLYNQTTEQSVYHSYNITNLKQYTQYAYYIKTQIPWLHSSIDSKLNNITQGQSEILYFRTLPDTPTTPFVTVLSKDSESITLTWSSITNENELIDNYNVSIFIQPDSNEQLDSRNYCTDPIILQSTNTVQDHQKCDCPNLAPKRSKYECGHSHCYSDFEEVQKIGRKVDREQFLRDNNISLSNGKEVRKRSVTEIRYEDTDYIMDKVLSFIPLKGHTPATDEPEYLTYKYYVGSMNISKSHTNYTIDNLKPYNLYTFQFFSCNNFANCSPYFMVNERTHFNVSADNLNITNSNYTVHLIDDEKRHTVNLHVPEPTNPNGLTVGYYIETLHVTYGFSDVTCVTRKEHARNGYIFTFPNLSIGQYGFRVKSMSLAGNGSFTNYIYYKFDGVTNRIRPTKPIVHVSIVLFIIISGCIGLYCFRRWRLSLRPNDNDEVFLLEEQN